MTTIIADGRGGGAVSCVVLKSFFRLFTSRKGSLTVAFEKQLADSTEKKYQDRKELVYVLRHWREDEVFAKQVSRRARPVDYGRPM